MRVPGLRDDAGVVPAAGQHEGDLGVGQQVELVDRAPRRHVVALGAHGEHRHADVGERDRPAARRRSGPRPDRCRGTAGAGTRCACGRACASRRRSRPSGRSSAARSPIRYSRTMRDQTRSLERRIWNAPAICWVSRKPCSHIMSSRNDELAFVDEQRQLARLGEVGLRGEERHRLQPLVAVARHRRRGDRQQRAAEAIADARGRWRPGTIARDRVERRHHAERAVVVQRQVAVLGARIASTRS